jgi:hypothetical protein
MICYVILSHRQPRQIVRLARTLGQSSDSAVVVHHDQSVTHLGRDQFGDAAQIHLVGFQQRIRWGTWDLVEVMLHCLRWADDNIRFDWVVFLSGQDYPLTSLGAIEQFFAKTRVDAYSFGVPVDPRPATGWQPSPEGLISRRYFYRYQEVPVLRMGTASRTAQMVRLGARLLTARQPLLAVEPFPDGAIRVGVRRFCTPFSEGAICFKGSQWFAASQKAVQILLRQTDLVRYYRRSLIPDESFVQTVLLNTPDLSVCNADLWFTRWQLDADHPDVLAADDVPDALASGKLFARKFDIGIDAMALDRIDNHIGSSATTR